MRLLGPAPSAAMSNAEQPFSSLRNSVMRGIEETPLNHIVQVSNGRHNLIKVPPVPVQHATNILKQRNVRLAILHCLDENGKTVPAVFQAQLMAANAKRLARRTANYHFRSRVKSGFKAVAMCEFLSWVDAQASGSIS